MITTLRSPVDAFTREDAVNRNTANVSFLRVSVDGAGEGRFTYIFFPGPEADANIAQALLRLWTRTGLGGGPYTITIRRISESWAEDRITWNNQPAVAGAVISEPIGSAIPNDTLVELDVTDLYAEAAAGEDWFGLRLEIDSSDNVRFHSGEAEDAAFHPELVVDWSTAPDAPSDLNPGGGQLVGTSQPIFTYTFADADGDEQEALEFQLDEVGDFAAPVVATGWILTPAQQYDLANAAPGFAGLVEATTYFWRVRARDENGIESPWSDTATVVFDARGALALNNPPAAPDNVVEETTPPISWAFTGETQTKYRVRVFSTRVVDGEEPGAFFEVHDSKIQTSTDTSYTIPPGVITSETETYRVQVRVWDDKNRVATPGFGVYVEAERDFTFDAAGVAAAVTSLVVTTDETPAFTLEWTRDATPDFFAIRIDGELFDDRIDPEDVRVDATTYRITLWEVDPGQHTFEVEPVVDSAGELLHTSGNPTQVATSAPVDAWLIMPSRDLQVALYSPDASGLRIGEEGETFHMIGRPAPVRRVGAIHGNEGVIRGRLASDADRATLEEIKSWARRGNKVVLVHGKRAYPVVLGIVSDAQPVSGSANKWFEASVELWQSGKFPIKDRR